MSNADAPKIRSRFSPEELNVVANEVKKLGLNNIEMAYFSMQLAAFICVDAIQEKYDGTEPTKSKLISAFTDMFVGYCKISFDCFEDLKDERD